MRGMYLGFVDDDQMARMPQFPFAQTITEPWPQEETEKAPKRGSRARARGCDQGKDKKSTSHPEQTCVNTHLNGVHVDSAIEGDLTTWQIQSHCAEPTCSPLPSVEQPRPKPPSETTDMPSIAEAAIETETDTTMEEGFDSEASGQVKAAGLLSTEYALIKPLVETRFEHPRVFVLMAQIVDAGEHQKASSRSERPLWVSTETLISRAHKATEEMRRGIYAGLRSAMALGLVSMRETTDGPKSNLWALTADGKRFLLEGAKTRLHLKNVNGWNFDYVCAQVASEEIEAREAQILEQEEAYQRVAGIEQTPRRRSGTPVVISRCELANAIQQQTLKRVKDAQATVTPLWAGLLR